MNQDRKRPQQTGNYDSVNPYAPVTSKNFFENKLPKQVIDQLDVGGTFLWDTMFTNNEFTLDNPVGVIRRVVHSKKSCLRLLRAFYFATRNVVIPELNSLDTDHHFIIKVVEAFWDRISTTFGDFTIPDSASLKFAAGVAHCLGWWVKKSVPKGLFSVIFSKSPPGDSGRTSFDAISNGGRGMKTMLAINCIYTPTFYGIATFPEIGDYLYSAYPITTMFLNMARRQVKCLAEQPNSVPAFLSIASVAQDSQMICQMIHERTEANRIRDEDIESYKLYQAKN